jgi:SAM-dependent methyltransferase
MAVATTIHVQDFPDWQPAPNIRDAPELYELENLALDPEGLVFSAMHDLAPWTGKVVVDLGCGTGFWLPRYAEAARAVFGVEPDPVLRALAAQCIGTGRRVTVTAGSAEHLPFADASVDVVHARFAYFFGPGADAGLVEVMRVLRPGGALVVVDNDYARGDFARILAAGAEGNAAVDPTPRDRWWLDQSAQRLEVASHWRFETRGDLERVLRNEFRDGAADAWLSAHPRELSLSCCYVLFCRTKAGSAL